MDAKEEIAAIRKFVKSKVPTVSVRNGRGTAWGWVEIMGSDAGGMFTETERTGLVALGLSPGGNFCVISPESRAFVLRRWIGQGDGRKCSFCPAEATDKFFCPCDLMHFTCDQHKRVTDCARAMEVTR